MPSIEPNSCTRLAAVLGPMPGTPGTLSTVSPIRAKTSITCSGVMPFASLSFWTSIPGVFVDVVHRHSVRKELLQVFVLGDDADVDVALTPGRSNTL